MNKKAAHLNDSTDTYLPQQPDSQSQQQQSADDAAGYHSHRNVTFLSGFIDRHHHLDSRRTGEVITRSVSHRYGCTQVTVYIYVCPDVAISLR